jgi:DNA (cytosine-5)-methyltransferase 1
VPVVEPAGEQGGGEAVPAGGGEPNPYRPESKSAIAQRRGHAGKPSPTILTGGFCPGNNAPLDERGVANHATNDAAPRKFNTSRRCNADDVPSKTLTADKGRDAPFISSHLPNDRPVCDKFNSDGRMVSGDEVSPTVFAQSISPLVERRALNNDPNDYKPRKFNSSSRVPKSSGPCPTVCSGGVVPGSDVPFVERHVAGTLGGYPAMLDRLLPREAPPTCGLRLAEFFCGCGGIGLGFRSAGYYLVFANDYYERAAESYGANLGHAPHVGDIRKVERQHVSCEEVDVVTGGFPCVTFSMAGKRMGVTDDIAGKLYLELCRQITSIRPRYFVAENVQGMLTANNGAAIKLVMAAFLRLGYRVAYELVCMAEHGVPQTRMRVVFVGVRMDQWRGAFRFPRKTHRLTKDKEADRWLPPAVSLREAIGDLPEPGEVLVGSMHDDSGRRMIDRANGSTAIPNRGFSRPSSAREPGKSQTASGPNYVVVNHTPNDARISEPHAMSKPLAHRADPSPTIVSEDANVAPLMDPAHVKNDLPAYAYNITHQKARAAVPGNTVTTVAQNVGFDEPHALKPGLIGVRNDDFANPVRDAGGRSTSVVASEPPELTTTAGLRRMTVRECARVQSFPDWYEFRGSQADGFRQVGNAVPPLYARQLALALLEYDQRKVL